MQLRSNKTYASTLKKIVTGAAANQSLYYILRKLGIFC